jgi:tetratricopeptide (TPR) repeat protein
METDSKDLLIAVNEEFNAVLQHADTLKPSPKPWEKVLKDLSGLLATGMIMPYALYLRGRAYYYSGLYEQAIADLEALLKGHRHSDTVTHAVFPPKRLRAMAKIRLGRFSEAEEDLRDEIELLQGVLPQRSVCRSDDYYWLLVCKFKGDEKAAMDEQAKFF